MKEMDNSPTASQPSRVVFLLDVDNTLLDNDRLKSDLDQKLRERIGPERTGRFWEIYEQVRQESQFVDYPRTVRLMAAELHEPALAGELSSVLDAIPFKSYVYPHVIETIDYLKSLGQVVIFSDGDPVFQPRKIRESGLEAAVDGNVIISVHKEDELGTIFARYPADHYVMIDDKPSILSALERECPSEFTTILVLQGKYASAGPASPRPDFVVPHIADVRRLTLQEFLQAGARRAAR